MAPPPAAVLAPVAVVVASTAAPVLLGLAAGSLGAALVGGLAGAAAGVLVGQFLPSAPGAVEQVGARVADRKRIVRSALAPARTIYGRAEVGGVMARADDDGDWFHMAIVVAEHGIDRIEQVRLWGAPLPLTAEQLDALNRGDKVAYGGGAEYPVPWSEWARERGLATAAEADQHEMATRARFAERVAEFSGFAGKVEIVAAPAGTVGGAAGRIAAAFPDWGIEDTARLDGLAWVALRLRHDEAFAALGFPSEVSFAVRGKRLVDPRAPGREAAFSDNPAVILRDFAARLGAPPDEAALAAAATECDRRIRPVGSAAAAPQWRANLVFDATDDAGAALEALEEAMGGALDLNAGPVAAHAGRTGTTRAGGSRAGRDLLPAEVSAVGEIRPRRSAEGAFNRAQPVFVDERDFEGKAATPVSAPEDIKRRGVFESDVKFEACPSAEQAGRLAQIALRRNLAAPFRLRLTCAPSARDIRPWDLILVSLPGHGLADAPMRVLSVGMDAETLAVDLLLTLEITDGPAAVHALPADPATAPLAPAPAARLAPPPVAGLALSEVSEVDRDGTTLVALRAAWEAPPGGAWRTEAELRPGVGAGALPEGDGAAPAPARSLETSAGALVFSGLCVGAYSVRARHVSARGRRGAWSVAEIVLGGDRAPPAAPRAMTARQEGAVVVVSMDAPTEDDVAGCVIRGVFAREEADLPGDAPWGGAEPLRSSAAFRTGERGKVEHLVPEPPLSGWYRLVARLEDRSGNLGPPAEAVVFFDDPNSREIARWSWRERDWRGVHWTATAVEAEEIQRWWNIGSGGSVTVLPGDAPRLRETSGVASTLPESGPWQPWTGGGFLLSPRGNLPYSLAGWGPGARPAAPGAIWQDLGVFDDDGAEAPLPHGNWGFGLQESVASKSVGMDGRADVAGIFILSNGGLLPWVKPAGEAEVYLPPGETIGYPSGWWGRSAAEVLVPIPRFVLASEAPSAGEVVMVVQYLDDDLSLRTAAAPLVASPALDSEWLGVRAGRARYDRLAAAGPTGDAARAANEAARLAAAAAIRASMREAPDGEGGSFLSFGGCVPTSRPFAPGFPCAAIGLGRGAPGSGKPPVRAPAIWDVSFVVRLRRRSLTGAPVVFAPGEGAKDWRFGQAFQFEPRVGLETEDGLLASRVGWLRDGGAYVGARLMLTGADGSSLPGGSVFPSAEGF